MHFVLSSLTEQRHSVCRPEPVQHKLYYGVVPKGLSIFLGSLYKEVAKTTSGTSLYRFERQTARKMFLPSQNTVLDLECRIFISETFRQLHFVR